MPYKVRKFTTDLQPLASWGVHGSAPGELLWPMGIAYAAPGFLYIADPWVDVVNKFTTDGSFITRWPETSPEDVAVNAAGQVFVTDTNEDMVFVYDGGGSLLTSWGGFGSGPGHFDWPDGIDIDARGYVYVADSGNDRVQVFRPTNPAVAPASLGRIKALFR